ncbi:2-hydroxyacyl-CoA dehydratase [Dyella tabacisoli]|uniref:2-hydroxyacyl-CoA dehydratase n=1 Tax=Dyella tabacisoli TaxID=2282381 RepID=A0A369UJW5_9GAMM|nr:2-hydroxyacyl-CoA dehydratase [Dyella tabacisoli]RDD81062.1 2-hydroxyacyl-CoA dehydratase [Dyella tabacisoli]
MNAPKDAFRRFQEELAALEQTTKASPPANTAEAKLERAKSEFLALRKRYGLSVADVVAFFPEEEGIEYLMQIIAKKSETKPRRVKKP